MTTINGKELGQIGYGLMGLTWRPKQTPYDQAFEVMKTALSMGSNFWNGGEFYGPIESNSLHLLNAYFTKYPQDADKVFISIKGGATPGVPIPTGDREGVQRSVNECLKVLDGKKKLDMFECARVDPKVPIEISIQTLAEYVKDGKLGSICLSECSADSIRRASKVHKISGVEVEFSLFATEIFDNGVAKTCAELGIPIFAYSPLSRGFLTHTIKSPDEFEEGDMRAHMPRFQPGNFEKNLALVDEVEKIAKKKGVPSGQVALAWVIAKGKEPGMPEIIPIPGTVTVDRVKENCTPVALTDTEMKELDEFVQRCQPAGTRYPEHVEALNFGDSPPLQS